MNLRLTFILAGGCTWQLYRSQNGMYPLWPKTSQLFISTFTSNDHSIGNSHYMFIILIKGSPIHLNTNPEHSIHAQNQPRCWMHRGESLPSRVCSLISLIDNRLFWGDQWTYYEPTKKETVNPTGDILEHDLEEAAFRMVWKEWEVWL